MPNNRRSDCPLSCFLDQWGDKWTFILLRDLLAGPKKFSGFLESDEPVAHEPVVEPFGAVGRGGVRGENAVSGKAETV